jgi:hypothetical protein
MRQIKKHQLIILAKNHDKATIVNVAQGKHNGKTELIDQKESEEICANFRYLL